MKLTALEAAAINAKHDANGKRVGPIERAQNSETDSVPGERESELHSQIADECCRRGWVAFHGVFGTRTRRTDSEPDFTVAASDGRVFFIELKTRKGKLTPGQFSMQHHLKSLGHTMHVCHSLAEFIEIVEP